jgi:hypothetical protein
MDLTTHLRSNGRPSALVRNAYVCLATKNVKENELAMQEANGLYYINQSDALSGRSKFMIAVRQRSTLDK